VANVAVIVDPDPRRRDRFVAAVAPRLHLVSGLVPGSCAAGAFHAVWAAASRAPVQAVSDSQGAAVIWGEAIAPASSERMTPPQLREQWRPESDPDSWLTWDGYFAAVVFDPVHGVVSGADLLGFFPLYYWSNGEVLMLASSPEPFACHPSFRAALDPAGLVGIMLTNGLFRGRALWKDVHRLPPAQFLRWRPGSAPVELADGSLMGEIEARDSSRRSPTEQLEAMDAAFERAVRRHLPPDDPCGLFLSGGLDSRLIAGYLDRQGSKPTALTLGSQDEIEMRCARRVARTLGIEHRTATVPYGLYPVFAQTLTSRWEHLANGGSVVFGWGTRAFLDSFPPRIATGIPLDWAAGGISTFGLAPEQLSFDRCFPLKINDSGFSPPLLARLLRRGVFGDLVEHILEEMRADYERLGNDPLRRLWHFVLQHRVRFNAGGAAWHLCFGSWPVVIPLDRDWFTTMAGIPPGVLADRKAEQKLLCTRFPALARLPLDRNGYLTTPLTAGRLRRFVDKFPSYVQTRWLAPRRNSESERRYYYRIYNLNNPGWDAVRRAAEPCRERLKALFVPEVLDEILPRAEEPVRYRGDLIAEGQKLKQLLILGLWAKEHL
jgi:asparagine synthase (glutamine-hydrolysing)